MSEYLTASSPTEEAERYMIGSNAIHGDWDFDLLKGFEMDLLIDLGFDQKELDDIWNKELKKEFDVEKELKEIKKAKTKLGDIIHLGNNRLICGDSTKQETLERLFGDERASMIMSDPIYNISIDYNKGIGGKQAYGGMVNDSKPMRNTKIPQVEYGSRPHGHQTRRSRLLLVRRNIHLAYSDSVP
jgi:hypothetical protein